MEAANDNSTTTQQAKPNPHQKALQVFSIRETDRTSCGRAYVNKDGSLNIYLEVVPLSGRLHVRATAARGEERAA